MFELQSFQLCVCLQECLMLLLRLFQFVFQLLTRQLPFHVQLLIIFNANILIFVITFTTLKFILYLRVVNLIMITIDDHLKVLLTIILLLYFPFVMEHLHFIDSLNLLRPLIFQPFKFKEFIKLHYDI